MSLTTQTSAEFTTLSTLDMRHTNGLVRRSVNSSVEEGGGSKDDLDLERSSHVVVPAPLAANAFRDSIRFISNCGPTVFTGATILMFLATLRSGTQLHRENTFLNFLHVWATITLMILCIMGLMNALKLEV